MKVTAIYNIDKIFQQLKVDIYFLVLKLSN